MAEQDFCCGVPCAPQPCSQVFLLPGAARADLELVASLAAKISLLERKIEKQAEEIQLKVKVSLLLSLLCPCPRSFTSQTLCVLRSSSVAAVNYSREPLQKQQGLGRGQSLLGLFAAVIRSSLALRSAALWLRNYCFFSPRGGAFPLLFSETADVHRAEPSWSSPLCISE